MKSIGEFQINKIYNMDCLEGMKKLPDNSVDLIVTDPPYNTGMTERKNSTWLNSFFDDFYTDEEYDNLVLGSVSEFYRILKNNSLIYIYINFKELGRWSYFMKKVGFNIKNVIVWDKVIHGLNYQNYAYTHEFIIFGVKGNRFPNNKIYYKGKQYYKDVWNIKRNLNQNEKHETVKHIDVVKLPILHGSNEEDIILDSFMGSGTTAVAAKQLNRNFIGFEISKEYVDLANKRLQQENIKRWF